MQNAECKMQNAKLKLRSTKRKKEFLIFNF